MLTPKTEMYSCLYILGVHLGLPNIKNFENLCSRAPIPLWLVSISSKAWTFWISIPYSKLHLTFSFNESLSYFTKNYYKAKKKKKKKLPVPKLRGTHFDQRHISSIQKRRSKRVWRRVLIHGVLFLHSPGLFYINVSAPLICSWLWFMFWYGANEPVVYSKSLGSPVKR